MAGDDAKEVAILERVASPKVAFQNYRELQKKLSSGEYRKNLPKDAKPEELAEWRKAQGIPEKPTDYDLTLEDGTVIGETDKAIAMRFVEKMHGENAPPSVVKAGLSSYFALRKEAVAKLQETDAANNVEVEELLRTEYGGEYRANINEVKAMLQSAPGDIIDKVLSARQPDNRRMIDDPDVVRWLVSQAKALHPTSTVVPAGGDQSKVIADEIKQIEGMMRTETGERNPAYYGNPAIQEKYARLIEARTRHSKSA